ncbi:MAG: hypothetical protein RQ966_18835 [Acetobacteraceae bacterium]|nr:hypothetical protein [Acetobacteraceae bacterium]
MNDEPPQTTLDRADVRVTHAEGFGSALQAFGRRARSGDLGSLPVVAGLLIVGALFTTLNPVFLSPNNMVNLCFDCSVIGVIALGIVCVLMLGEIDLSVGSMSGVASALLGVLWVGLGIPAIIAIGAALLVGALVGTLYAQLRMRFGMPSFSSTLAGLLALLGWQLYLLGATGSINLPYESAMVSFGQFWVLPAWLSEVIALLPGVGLLAAGLRARKRRRRFNLSVGSFGMFVVQVAGLTIMAEAVVFYLNRGRGVPVMFLLFIVLVLVMQYAFDHTQWGRSMRAVGGNPEAARRSGINVPWIYTTAFALCSAFAALGGILGAARLASSSQQAGTGDVNLNAIAAAVIGGTSLFGGRGSAWSALLGIIVIQAISNGLTLLNMSSSLRYMITGAVLAIAVLVDSLARRSRVTHGRA